MWPAIAIIPELGGWLELIAKAIAGAIVYAAAALAIDAGGARSFVQDRLNASNEPPAT